MALTPGTRIGTCEIVAPLGSGGMGEVYRATDTRLRREVAVKVLPEDLAGDPERLGRFEREAQILAALNHPHIAAIYGVEESEGRRCLVLELVEGRTLASRLDDGPVPLKDAIAAGLQIASALEAAHEKGIVHRDLKPGNVMLRPDGTVKVLDFGLSKAVEGDPASSTADLTQSPTLTAMATQAGMILGTAAYMSPEQARGRAVDKRADVWALGVVLYEMLTGGRLFTGEDVSDTLAAVLKTEPDWGALPDDLPAPLRGLLRRCLEKDPRRRLRDVGEARILLEDLLEGRVPEEAAVEMPETRRGIGWPAAALLVAAVGAVAAVGGWLARPVPEPAPVKFTVAADELDNGAAFALSPDGRTLAFAADDRLWIRRLDSLEPHAIPGAEGGSYPFWSPDGTMLGYLASRKVWKVAPLGGGDPTAISDLPIGPVRGAGASWSEDGRIAYASGSEKLWEIPARGGDPRPLLEADAALEEDHFHEPHWLPGNRGLLFTIHRPKNSTADSIAVLEPGGSHRVLVRFQGQTVHRPVYSPTGHILFERSRPNDGIWAVPFSLDALETSGEPFVVVPSGRWPSASQAGGLACTFGGQSTMQELVWVDRQGNAGETVGQQQTDIFLVSLSPDGGRAVVTAYENENFDLWIQDLRRGVRTRLTFDPEPDWNPAWSPDGTQVVFESRDEIRIITADGTGTPVELGPGNDPIFTPDGRWIVYAWDSGAGTGSDLWMRPADGDGEPREVLKTPAEEDHPSVSPDGSYVLYSSPESGQEEIYLRRFPSGEGKWQVSTDGGGRPSWRGDGREIFYRTGNTLMAVEVDLSGGVPVLGRPGELYSVDGSRLRLRPRRYDASSDGQRFLHARDIVEETEKEPAIAVFLNWFTEFRPAP